MYSKSLELINQITELEKKEIEQIEYWKYLEYKINVPKEMHLRMQLNILKPGEFWIDDVQIMKM